MKQTVTMLATLDGVDEGMTYPATYHAGREYQIGDELLRCFVELGAVEITGLMPRDLAEGGMLEEGELPPAHMPEETRVDGPEEIKPAAPASKKKK